MPARTQGGRTASSRSRRAEEAAWSKQPVRIGSPGHHVARTRACTASTISNSARSFRKPDRRPRLASGGKTTTSEVIPAPGRDEDNPASRSRDGAAACPSGRPEPSKHTPIRSRDSSEKDTLKPISVARSSSVPAAQRLPIKPIPAHQKPMILQARQPVQEKVH